MKSFEFSNSIISNVLNELEKAERFIKIAVFQIHLDELFDLLERKINNGVQVSIFTLPYDSIHNSVRKDVVSRLMSLSEQGANLYFCKWNVGDPSRTTTAIGRWYSFHGKFIVTDKSAIVLSANFTRINELDAALTITDEYFYIKEFEKKFDELLTLFVNKYDEYEGNIRNKIINSGLDNIIDVFELPEIIETDIHQRNWIKHYPASLCPPEIDIKEKLYMVPFDVRGRNIYHKIISEAEKFIYISSESFTDTEFGLFLSQLKIENHIDIKLLTGSTSMDFTDRINKMYRELIANDIKLFTIDGDLHAKLIITDKHLLVGSINLNKMNLGFNKTKKFWRENTETIFITPNTDLINKGKQSFENQLTTSIKMEIKLAEKIQVDVSRILNKSFKIRTKKEVKILFSKFILIKEIEQKKDTNKLARLIKKLMIHYNIKTLNKDTFFMAVILFYLQDRKHTFSEIKDKLKKLDSVNNLTNLIEKLSISKFIDKKENFYRINIESLFK